MRFQELRGELGSHSLAQPQHCNELNEQSDIAGCMVAGHNATVERDLHCKFGTVQVVVLSGDCTIDVTR